MGNIFLLWHLPQLNQEVACGPHLSFPWDSAKCSLLKIGQLVTAILVTTNPGHTSNFFKTNKLLHGGCGTHMKENMYFRKWLL